MSDFSLKIAILHGLSPWSWSVPSCSSCQWSSQSFLEIFPENSSCPQCGNKTKVVKKHSQWEMGTVVSAKTRVRFIEHDSSVWNLMVRGIPIVVSGSIVFDYRDHGEILKELPGIDVEFDGSELRSILNNLGFCRENGRITDEGRLFAGKL